MNIEIKNAKKVAGEIKSLNFQIPQNFQKQIMNFLKFPVMQAHFVSLHIFSEH